MPDDPITVLIVDDQEDIRVLVRSVLELEGIEVVTEASDGTSALRALGALDPPVPTVIVLDDSLPELTGLDVAERVLDHVPEQRIILFSAFLTGALRTRAEAMGVRACVGKDDVMSLPEVIRSLV